MVPYGPGIPQVNPAPRLHPIIKPGTPRWVTLLVENPLNAVSAFRQVGIVLGFMGVIVAGGAGVAQLGVRSPAGAVIAMVVLLGALAGLGAVWWRGFAANVVGPPGWKYCGASIRGDALRLLEDIDTRFNYARRMIDEVPTGIEWSDVADDIRALMWDSAGHAARVTALDSEIHEMRYAARGTPQAAFRRELQERRGEHWRVMKDAQREAEDLASVAGNAAAAAKLALVRTGSLAALEVVAPSPRAIVARNALADARARLQILADIWAQLDDSNVALAESIDADFERSRQVADPPVPRRRRQR